MPVKSCEVCGAEFNARLNRIRTCGVQCRNRLISSEREAKHRMVKSCEVCKAEFEVGSDDKNKRTCSDACGYALRGSKTSKRVEMSCVTCSGVFAAVRSQIAAGGGKYCSKACMYDRNKASTTRQCSCCGKGFSAPPSHAHVKTCSTECGYKISHGPNAPNYRGLTQTSVVNGKKIKSWTRFGAAEINLARRLSVERATPAWANLKMVREIYELAAKIEKLTGAKHHVDHMVPLTSKLVCGLHNEFNLRVVSVAENLKKGNRHWPDMW